jgi:hypothetical protein
LDEPGCVLCDFWIKFVIDKLGWFIYCY